NLLKLGNQVSIISYGMAVHWCLEVLENHPEIDADLIDLRTLVPLDSETIFTSVKKTGKVLIVHEDTLTAGFASDIAALIAENCFEYLDAPIKRLGSLDTPIPFTKLLEDQFMAKSKLEQVLIKLMNY
ncbi:MAG: transketolase C-terminal domain-containing protein, partial [Flavobacteriaceae bacterium]|nr:transketolase C-terminal domain-containing protein [Flavobacteriaceae bacterium]